MTDKQLKAIQFCEDLKEQLLIMYNIKITRMGLVKGYERPGYEDLATHIRIEFIGGYQKRQCVVLFQLHYEELEEDDRYLHLLSHYTLDFGTRVYNLIFGDDN